MNLLILHVKKSSTAVLMAMNAIQMDCESVYLRLLNNQVPQKCNTYHNDFKEPLPHPPQVSLLCAAFGGNLPLMQ